MNWLHQWIHCNSFTSKSNVWKEKTFNVIQIVAMSTYQAVVFIWVYIFIWVCQSMGPWMCCVSVCMSMCVFVCERDIKSELSYTCTNDHLYKTATCLRQSVLSPSKQILIKLFLYKTITCLTRPATTCFVHQMKKKKLYKTTTTKSYPAEKWEANIRQQCINNKSLSDCICSIYCYFIFHSLLNVCKN